MTVWSKRMWVLGSSLLLLVLLYAPTSASFLHQWSRDPLGHGYLVLPGALYLAWTRRERLQQIDSRPAFWWLPLLALLSLLWLVANLTSTTGVQQFCLAAMVVGFVWGTLGTAAARELALPLGFLLFAVPIGDYLVPTLQNATAAFAVKLLQLSGVPVLLRGEIISIPGSTWEVASACSGINYLMSALVMAYLYAGLAFRSALHRTLFFLSAIPVALVANGVRVYITIFVAASGAPEFANGMRHSLVGWVVFAIILGVMFLIGSRFEEPDSHASPAIAAKSVAVLSRRPGRMTMVFVGLGLAIVGVAPLSASRFFDTGRTTRGALALAPIRVSAPWSPTRDVYNWAPLTGAADAVFAQTYAGGRRPVKLRIAYYDASRGDLEVGNTAKLLAGDGWIPGPIVRTAATVGGAPVEVKETVLQSATSSILVWTWFSVENTRTSRDFVAKLLLARSRLGRSERPSAAVAIATDNQFGADAAAVLQDFLAHVSIDPADHRP